MAIVSLTPSLISAQALPQYDVGIDFRNTQNYVTDPAYAVFDNCLNDGTNQQTQTNSNGQSVTWQWSQKCNAATDQSNSIDPRLAGIGSVYTASGGETLTITVPQPGTYAIGFATGSAVGNQCGGGKCPNFIFKDGASGTQLFTVNPNNPGSGHFIDAANNNWTAAQWPTSNQEQTVSLTGTTLTVSMAAANAPGIAHIRITYVPVQNFTLSASPASLSIQQGTQGTSTITSTVSGGFNNAISLSASGMPSGTTVSFNPSTIPAPGSGTSTMTITVGSSTPVGIYPITVTGNGGGVQQSATVSLTVTSSVWGQGFDFRNTSTLVTDPPGDTYVLSTTAYPTKGTGVTYGWVNTSLVQARDRNAKLDPRLAGINFVTNGSPATFYVDLPSAGTYNLSLAMGDAGYAQCSQQCQVQFLDGSTVLATVTGGPTQAGYFYDAKGNNWSAAAWPSSNVSQQVTLAGTRLTVVVGKTQATGTYTTIAFLGVTQVSGTPNFTLSALPASLSVAQGNQGTSSITTTISGGFNSAISLSASGMPSGTTVSFNPNPIPAPGGGNSTMTITVGSSTPTGTYPITVTGNGGGIQQTTTVTLTVTPQQQQSFTLSASPASLSIQQGNQGASTITTTISGGFNSAIGLSASGMPSGTTVSFNPNPIPAPGSGSSTMTITVGSSTPTGTYPITVTGNGGGIQQSATLTLTVTGSGWAQGFDFRNTTTLVTDPPGDTAVIQASLYPTTGLLTTYGWLFTATFGTRDRNKSIDPRLAGINYANNGTPTAFYVDLPAPGTYNLSLAMGDAGSSQCGTRCQIQFLDGANVLATVTGGPTNLGYFYDAQGKNWSAAQWPANNVSQQVTLVGTQLTVLVGTNQNTGDVTPIAYLGLTQVSNGPTFALQAPTSISVGQGQYSTAGVFTVLIGAFNSAVSLSATGAPAGATVSFNPSTIPAPGAGTSVMTISVPNNTPLGNYPLTVTAAGGGIIQNETFALTVTVADPPAFTLTAPSAVSTVPGGQVAGSVLTTVSNGFNSAVSLSSTGAPNGTTVNFNPSTIPAPGAGSSSLSINVPAGTAYGSYPITVTAASGQGNQTAVVTLTVSASGQVNLPAGTGWVSLFSEANLCSVSPGHAYYNPQVGAVDANDFLHYCEDGQIMAYGGGTADTTNDRYFLWTSGHMNYQGNEMYQVDLQGASPTISRVTDPAWTDVNTDVPPDCACKGTKNCGQGMWHDGAGNQVSSPYLEAANGGPLFESIPAPDGSDNQPSCGYGSKFQPNAREIYSGIVYNAPANKIFTWGGYAAAFPSGTMFSNWTLDLNQNPAQWTRLKDSSYPWYTAAVYDYTSNHPTSGDDLVFDENQTLYAYNPATDTYTVLSNTLQYIGYNANMELDPVHHSLVMENGDDYGGYHIKIVNIDSCNGKQCTVTSLDNTASCRAAMGYWAGLAWDSRRNVMAIFPSATNCSGAGCTPPFNTAYLLNPDPNNPVTITYKGQPQTIQPQQCFAATYGNTPTQSAGPGVYSRFKYYPNEDIYLYIPNGWSPWILRLEQ